MITQDFTTIELGANVSATLSERAAAKIRTLIMAIETGDKQHHHRVFLCSNDESESSDFFFLRAAWYQLLRQDSSYTPPIDMTVRSAKRIDVWSDGASGQFKQRYALMMFYNLLRLGGGLVPFRVNFLAPGHGHSLADACAARLKQAANRLLLRREGDRAAGVLFSVASPTLLQFATHASKHLRNTTISRISHSGSAVATEMTTSLLAEPHQSRLIRLNGRCGNAVVMQRERMMMMREKRRNNVNHEGACLLISFVLHVRPCVHASCAVRRLHVCSIVFGRCGGTDGIKR